MPEPRSKHLDPSPTPSAAPKPAAAKPGAAAEPWSHSPPAARNLTRVAVAAAVGLLTLTGLVVATRWAYYRYRHVVVSQATVRGTITRIGARIEGKVAAIEAAPGQHVTKGQVLVRLEDAHLQAALGRARAEVEAATKELDSEKLGIEQSRRRLTIEMSHADAIRRRAAGQLEAEQSNLDRLEKRLERVATLSKTGLSSASELDQTTGERDRAKGLLNAAMATRDSAEAAHQKAANELEGIAVRESRLGVLESQLGVARSKLATANADLEAALLRAPEDGTVVSRIVEVGGSAKVGEPILSLWLGNPWVEAWVDERDLTRVHVGSPAEVSLDSDPGTKIAARVESIGLESDKQLDPAPVPATLHAFVRPNALVPVRIGFLKDHPPISMGLSAMVGIRADGDAPRR